ncbi:SpoIIE family protein phosphatase [Streptomyces specialis]|uniref:SpoIIE family protein phosphatase n=1 Tax=Streptomyces specialis TaxID=498367 RepID=UPI00073EE1F7|nr:SpoIIE family protein phosphatase [Streptomyces specialis]
MDGIDDVAAERAVSRALRATPDAVIVLGAGDGRVRYANPAARRLAGPDPVPLTGRVLWEALPRLREAGLPARCASVAAVREPATFELDRRVLPPGHRVRLVPVDDCVTLYLAPLSADQRAERDASERARLIGALTGALAQALSSQDVAHAAAEHVLPAFGASGLVLEDVTGGQGPELVGIVGYPPDFPRRMAEADRRQRLAVLGGEEPKFIGSRAEMDRLSGGLDLSRTGGKHSWAVLPLNASGRFVGTCVISYDRPRTFSDEERGLLTTLNGLIAQALERARLYDTEHERAQRFQRDLLPRVLPALPALTAAARYRPAGERSEAGGDWYDTLPLSSGRVALVIGDVLGHGQRAAMVMGRLRTAVTTLTTLDPTPEEVLARLNDIVTGLDDEVYATCLYAVYDPVTGCCALASAGHPPPAVLPPDGAVRFPVVVPGPPLGVTQQPYRPTELTLPEGTLLALWTDGLTRAHRAERDAGRGRLATALNEAALSPAPPAVGCRDDRAPEAAWLERLCDAVTAALLPAGREQEDDAALLALRTHLLPAADVASWDLPDDPTAARLARHHIREQLAAWDLEDLVASAELVVSELMGNVIRHATGPAQLRLLRTDILTCEVSDASEATPRVRHASLLGENGRGLQLVGASTSRWGARYVRHGKTIWAEFPLPRAPRR